MRAGRTSARTERPMAERFARRAQESTCRSDEARGDPGRNPTRDVPAYPLPDGPIVCLLVPTVPYTTATYGETPCLGGSGYGRYPAGTKHLYVGDCPWSADCRVLVVMVIAKYLLG